VRPNPLSGLRTDRALKAVPAGVGDLIADTHNALTAIALRARPSSRGTVRLTGSHPQDPLAIAKQHFQAPGGTTDVAALRDGVKRARAIVEGSLMAAVLEKEIFPGANASTDEAIEQHVYDHVFGALVFPAALCCVGAETAQGIMRVARRRWAQTMVRAISGCAAPCIYQRSRVQIRPRFSMGTSRCAASRACASST
jgi:hypothetical protein